MMIGVMKLQHCNTAYNKTSIKNKTVNDRPVFNEHEPKEIDRLKRHLDQNTAEHTLQTKNKTT